MNKMKTWIQDRYDIDPIHIEHHRDMIGSIYFLSTCNENLVLKIYKTGMKEPAIQSIGIMEYLHDHGGPVPKVLLTKEKFNHTILDGQVSVLFAKIEGREASWPDDADKIRDAHEMISTLMKDYSGPLTKRDRTFYVDRWIHLLKNAAFAANRIETLAMLGTYFFERVSLLPKGFCHGDFHTGNIIIQEDQAIVLDFDAAALFSPSIDDMTLYDATNFNHYSHADFLRTLKALREGKRFDEKRIEQMMAFVPLRHYELIATIIENNGMSDVKPDLFDEQYEWIVRYHQSYQATFGTNPSSGQG